MTDIDSAAGMAIPEAGGRCGPMKMIMIIGLAVLFVVGAGGAVWWFVLGGKAQFSGARHVEAPLPSFLAMKPFVIRIGSTAGAARFVQMGPTLQLSAPTATELVNAVLPQVQDVIRQTVLTVRPDELQKADGINRLRTALLSKLNEMLVQALGPERIERVNGKPDASLFVNIYFPTLVVE